MSESLKADLYGLGNINKAFSESADGDIVFTSHLVPYGIKLSTLLGQDLTELTQVLAEIDAIYQAVLDLEIEDIYDVIGGVAHFTVPISASTYYGDGSNLTGIGNTFLELQDTPSTYTGVQGYLVRVQGSDLNFVDPALIETSPTFTLAVSASLNTKINDNFTFLQNQIFSNDADIATKADTTTLAAISAYILSEIEDISGFGSGGNVDTTLLTSISANLQGQIWSNDTDIAGLSGSVFQLEQTVNTLIGDITGGATLDDRYVNVDGDTMTGDLTLASISGQEAMLKVDNAGTIQTHPYAPFIGGQLILNSTDSLYTITDSNIKATTNPVCTLIAPLSSSTIYALNVFDVTTGQFKVALSDIPAISGYTLNWMALEYN
jgi:hypothetical protein